MIWVQFITSAGDRSFNEPCVEVPHVGDSVMLGDKLWDVKHRRWVPASDDGMSDMTQLFPEVVIS